VELLALVVWPLLVAWPLPRVAGSALLTAPDQEAATHVWGHWAAWKLGAAIHLNTALMGFPDGVSLQLIDPLGALVAGPLIQLGGPALGYNALVWVGLVLAGLSGALLAQRLDLPRLPALVLSTACPTLLANTADGMTEGFLVALVPLQALALLHARDRGSLRAVALAGLTLGATAWAGPYNAVWALLIDGVLLVHTSIWRPRGRRPVLGSLALGGLLMAPVAWAIFTARDAGLPGGAARAGLPEIVENPAIFRGGVRTGADLLDPLLPGFLTGGQADPSHTAYVGLGVVCLAGLAAWRTPRLRPWLAGGLAFVALSLGPWLYLGGEVLRAGGAPLAGPAGLLMLAVPPLARLSRWYRAGAVASLLLAPLALETLRGRRPLVVGLATAALVADLLWLAPMAWPLHTSAPPAPWPLEGEGAVLELPPATTGQPPPGAWRDVGALAQVQHGRPVGGAFMNLGTSQDARTATAALREALRAEGLDGGTQAVLRERGFRWIAVHRHHFDLPLASERALRCAGAAVVDRDDALVVDLERAPRGGCAEGSR
jgi:hypothetical protein